MRIRGLNKKAYVLLMAVITAVCLLGCAKKAECAYCGEEKYCNEYDILGVTRFICDDCLNDPRSSISGNVLLDYESEYVDPALYIVSVNDIPEAAVSDNGFVPIGDDSDIFQADLPLNDSVSSDVASEDTVIPVTPVEPVTTTTTPDTTQTQSTTPSTNVNINTKGKDTVIANIQNALSSQGYYLQQADDTDTKYNLYNGNTSTGIVFDFSGSDSSSTKLTASQPKSASDVDFLNACVCSALGFLGSDDYYGTGAEVYNNVVEHGKYSYDGCKFYYLESSDKEIADGGPIVRFQASYQ